MTVGRSLAANTAAAPRLLLAYKQRGQGGSRQHECEGMACWEPGE
jgi:hypothetical protein